MSMLHRYYTKWKLRVNINKTEAILFTKRRPAIPSPLQFQHRYPFGSTYQIPWPRARLQTPLYKTLAFHYTQGHRYFSQTLSSPRPRFYTIPTQQTHPIQITDPPRTHLRCPRLEQCIVY